MLEEALKHLTHQGLQAVQAAGKIGAKAADQVEKQATAPELRDALRHGTAQAKTWADRVAKVQQLVHGDDREGDNPIIEAHQKVAERIARHAKDDQERDLGLIAASQLALHYYIAAFGTLAAYVQAQGQTEAAGLLRQCTDEAKEWDDKYTGLAAQMMQGGSKS